MSIIYTRNIPMLEQVHPKSVKPQSKIENVNCFSNTVLIGNWFEERFTNRVNRKAVAPGIYGESECYKPKTLYRNDFQQPVSMSQKEVCDEFVKWRQLGFSNRLNSVGSNIRLWDGDQFANNLTTFNDIMFRIKPNKEPNEANRTLNEDYMRSYGNKTKTGRLYLVDL